MSQRAYRLDSIDMLRGLVILIMAIDHVRDFFMTGAEQDPMSNPKVSAAVFFTRWITHFCAPVFVLLAGVSAGLMTSRRSRGDIARLLLTRGLWLIFVEVFVISTALTFAPGGIPQLGGAVFVLMQVIWVIGASMLLLAGLQWLGRPLVLGLGAAIVVGHNLLDPIWPASRFLDQQWPWWVALHAQMALHIGPFLFAFAYPLLPWLGVMLVDFGASGVFELAADRRNRLLLRAGLAMIAAFAVLRTAGIYGDPGPWNGTSAFSFLNTTKYPPSLEFVLMTIGPAAVLCSFADGLRGWLKDTLVMFGRVPFAFYVPHFFLIHGLCVLLGLWQGFSAKQMTTVVLFRPEGYGIGIAGVYAVWLLVIAILYPLCRWMAALKARRRDWWLSYL